VRVPPAADQEELLREALAATRGTVLDLRSHLSDLRAAQDFLRLSRHTANARAEAAEQREAVTRAELVALRAHCDALTAERDWLRGVRDAYAARIEELESITRRTAPLADEVNKLAVACAELTAQRDAMARAAAVLDRLRGELRWDAGPRAARAVLPLARALRGLAAVRTGRTQ
jgi:chromosome segregation ATPase